MGLLYDVLVVFYNVFYLFSGQPSPPIIRAFVKFVTPVLVMPIIPDS